MKSQKLLHGIALAWLLGQGSTGRADDWPQWRGPQRDSVWRETGLLETFPPEGLKPLWRAPVGPGFSSPVVAQGRVFVTDAQITRPKARERVLCFDAKTGKSQWSRTYEVDYAAWAFDPKNPFGPRPTPLVSGNKLFALGARGRLSCLQTLNGRVIWERNLENKNKDSVFTPSPLIEGELLILVLDGLPPGPCVVALDKDSGNPVWTALNETPTLSSPIVVNAGGKRQLLVWTQNALNSLDPATGKLYWRERCLVGAAYAIATPVVQGEWLLVNGTMFKLDSTKPAAALLWPDGVPPARQTISETSMAMLKREHVFTCNLAGELVCLDAITGRTVWTTNRVTDTKNGASIHITANGNSEFLFNDHGELIRAELTAEGYKEMSRTLLLQPTYPFGPKKKAWVPPAYADGRVYARSDEELVCVSLKSSTGKHKNKPASP
jgi:outer membrane protein assembly factor BamB